MDLQDSEFDLSTVLKQRMLSLRVGYVLIIDWLFTEDDQTGAVLRDRLNEHIPSTKIEYVRCRSAAEVREALQIAIENIDRRGVPIVHLEAHGQAPSRDTPPMGLVGPDDAGGSALLAWDELAGLLRPLNFASRFNLLVVVAACYGEGLMIGAMDGEPMPFVGVVGYTDTVSPLSVKHSLFTLYRELLRQQSELGDSVDVADRERHFPEDAALRLTPMTVLVAESFIEGAARRLRELLDRLRVSPGATDASALVAARTLLGQRLANDWAMLWMFDRFPENESRFAIDIGNLVSLAIDHARVSLPSD